MSLVRLGKKLLPELQETISNKICSIPYKEFDSLFLGGSSVIEDIATYIVKDNKKVYDLLAKAEKLSANIFNMFIPNRTGVAVIFAAVKTINDIPTKRVRPKFIRAVLLKDFLPHTNSWRWFPPELTINLSNTEVLSSASLLKLTSSFDKVLEADDKKVALYNLLDRNTTLNGVLKEWPMFEQFVPDNIMAKVREVKEKKVREVREKVELDTSSLESITVDLVNNMFEEG